MMKSKKTTTAKEESRSIIYFLIGLNTVLLVVWFMFGTRADVVKVENEIVVVNDDYSDAFIIAYEKPEVSEPEIIKEEFPEPEIDLTVIEEVENPIPEDQVVIMKPIDKVTTPVVPVGTKNFSLNKFNDLKTKASAIKEETVLEEMSPREVTYMAIYPGCEQYKGDKEKLTQCFGAKLGQDLSKNLDTTFPDVNKDQLVVQMQFKVDTEGNIIDIVPARGDDELKLLAKQALEKVADKLNKSKKRIVPAKMNDDSYAILKMTNTVILKNGN
ncbi:hypothetical protein GO491_10680 [Flavobacteriaceae bacterium Ap0902]|nr:hypothetical protein [Flavobacteriaceae bacterium Ap0902]